MLDRKLLTIKVFILLYEGMKEDAKKEGEEMSSVEEKRMHKLISKTISTNIKNKKKAFETNEFILK